MTGSGTCLCVGLSFSCSTVTPFLQQSYTYPTRPYLLITPLLWAKYSNTRIHGGHTYSNCHSLQMGILKDGLKDELDFNRWSGLTVPMSRAPAEEGTCPHGFNRLDLCLVPFVLCERVICFSGSCISSSLCISAFALICFWYLTSVGNLHSGKASRRLAPFSVAWALWETQGEENVSAV